MIHGPEYRIQIGGQTRAQSYSVIEIARYVYQYAADGEVVLQKKVKQGGRWETVLTVPQFEGEGQNDD